jgi:hypothetical protein
MTLHQIRVNDVVIALQNSAEPHHLHKEYTVYGFDQKYFTLFDVKDDSVMYWVTREQIILADPILHDLLS